MVVKEKKEVLRKEDKKRKMNEKGVKKKLMLN